MNIQRSPKVSPSAFRNAMGHFVTGVTIVTSASDSGPTGMTVNSLTSVSLDPCQLLVCLKKSSITGQSIKQSKRFGVSLLSRSQKDLALRFAKPSAERFDGIQYRLDDFGVPMIDGSLAHLACEVEAIYPSGDHDIYIGVVRSCLEFGSDPLIFFKGSFDLLTPAHDPE